MLISILRELKFYLGADTALNQSCLVSIIMGQHYFFLNEKNK